MRTAPFDVGWSPQPFPRQERERTPRGAHVHECGCGRYRICTTPLDHCDLPAECPWCIDDRRRMTAPATPQLFPTAKPKKPRRPPSSRHVPPTWTGGRKRR